MEESMKQRRPKLRKNYNKTPEKSEENNDIDILAKMRRRKEELSNDIKSLEDKLLDDDNTENEKSWESMIEGLKKELEKVDEDIKIEEQKRVDDFMKNTIKIRRQINKDDRKVFQIAKKDAEDRIYEFITFPPQLIAECFSTHEITLEHDKGDVVPPKLVFSWFHDLRKKSDNVIPLSPGLQVPRKKDLKTGEMKDIQFLISLFYRDKKFINRCKKYYDKFGLDISINEDKKAKGKWWIRLKVLNNEGKIKFN